LTVDGNFLKTQGVNRSAPPRVWIVKLATVTPLGGSHLELWKNLLAGQTAIRPISRFSTAGYKSHVAACIPDLAATDGRSMIHDLMDRLMAVIGPVPSDAFLLTATTKAGIDNLERIKRGGPADPHDILLASVPQAIRGGLGLRDPGINVSAACASSTIAVARGAAMIASGIRDAVLVCCADLVTEFVFSGFSSLGALSPGPSMPFDRRRSGMSLGDGAAALLLMSPQRAQKENHPALATVLGWGAANDAAHITAPARDGSGLVRAIELALTRSGLHPEAISAVCAHGTGTIHNDVMELTAFHNVFGEREFPVFSIKGAIGHSLGASGGIEAALSTKILAEQMAPPTTGFVEPETGAEKWVQGSPRGFSGDCLLSTNSGFAGINAALIFGKGDPS
jgi:3-oxoacyl-[acyl-carrier-protein] synthase II